MNTRGMAIKGVASQRPLADAAFVRRLQAEAREHHVETAADFSRFMGVSPQTGHKWWIGATKNLAARDLFRIAAKLGVSAEWLLTGAGPKKQPELILPAHGWESRFIVAYRASTEAERKIAHAWVENQEQAHAIKKIIG